MRWASRSAGGVHDGEESPSFGHLHYSQNVATIVETVEQAVLVRMTNVVSEHDGRPMATDSPVAAKIVAASARLVTPRDYRKLGAAPIASATHRVPAPLHLFR